MLRRGFFLLLAVVYHLLRRRRSDPFARKRFDSFNGSEFLLLTLLWHA